MTKKMLSGVLPVLLLGATACAQMSEHARDEGAGMNGGFEHTRDGLPVNWQVYSPSTVPSGDFDLVLDREEFKEGRQSLKFQVRECSPDGGWGSPGIAQQFPAEPGAAYRVSYWIRNEGSDYEVRVGGVAPKVGESVAIDATDPTIEGWQRVEQTYVMPAAYDSLRFELSIRSPGTLWIDDVRIEPAVSRSARR